MLGYSAIVYPETVMDWKSKELPKIIDGCQLKDVLNVDETGLFCNLQPSKILTCGGDSCHGGINQSRGSLLCWVAMLMAQRSYFYW
jgi:hypothetical protein